MSVGVVGGVISALNRYDLQNYVSLTQTAIRVIGVVVLLRSGHGIVAIALCELAATVVGNLLLVWVAYRLYPRAADSVEKAEEGDAATESGLTVPMPF